MICRALQAGMQWEGDIVQYYYLINRLGRKQKIYADHGSFIVHIIAVDGKKR